MKQFKSVAEEVGKETGKYVTHWPHVGGFAASASVRP